MSNCTPITNTTFYVNKIPHGNFIEPVIAIYRKVSIYTAI